MSTKKFSGRWEKEFQNSMRFCNLDKISHPSRDVSLDEHCFSEFETLPSRLMKMTTIKYPSADSCTFVLTDAGGGEAARFPGFFIPEEWQTILSVFYSHLPPTKIGNSTISWDVSCIIILCCSSTASPSFTYVFFLFFPSTLSSAFINMLCLTSALLNWCLKKCAETQIFLWKWVEILSYSLRAVDNGSPISLTIKWGCTFVYLYL